MADTKTVPEILREAADTYEQRNKLYGSNYKRIGEIFCTLFPDGVILKEKDDWNRMLLLVQLVGKQTRYAAQFVHGGHPDSAHDSIVYAAMLEELTK